VRAGALVYLAGAALLLLGADVLGQIELVLHVAAARDSMVLVNLASRSLTFLPARLASRLLLVLVVLLRLRLQRLVDRAGAGIRCGARVVLAVRGARDRRKLLLLGGCVWRWSIILVVLR